MKRVRPIKQTSEVCVFCVLRASVPDRRLAFHVPTASHRQKRRMYEFVGVARSLAVRVAPIICCRILLRFIPKRFQTPIDIDLVGYIHFSLRAGCRFYREGEACLL
jgi:hypothetical protein